MRARVETSLLQEGRPESVYDPLKGVPRLGLPRLVTRRRVRRRGFRLGAFLYASGVALVVLTSYGLHLAWAVYSFRFVGW